MMIDKYQLYITNFLWALGVYDPSNSDINMFLIFKNNFKLKIILKYIN